MKNMIYDINELKTALFGLVGFEQNIDPEGIDYEADLLVTRSGVLVNQQHPLLSSRNIQYITQLVSSKRDSASISAFARSAVHASINSILAKVFTKKENDRVGKTVLENIKLFDQQGRIKDSETPIGSLVGIKITPKKYDNIALILERIGLQFTESQTDLDIYIYHSSQLEPIEVRPVSTLNPKSTNWLDFKYQLDYYNENYLGGCFFFCYYQNDIAGRAINMTYDFNSLHCSSCGGKNYKSMYRNFIDFMPFEVLQNDLEPSRNLWDLGQTRLTPTQNHGINIASRIQCDLTGFIKRNESILANALAKEVGRYLLDMMQNNIETSGSSKQLSQNAFTALKNEHGGEGIYLKELNRFVDGVNFNFSGLSSPCMAGSERGISLGVY